MSEGSGAPGSDAALAAVLFAIDPTGLGGLVLRGWPGPARDELLRFMRALLAPGVPVVRVPIHVTADRLLGGIALAETLQSGRVVLERGLLGEAHGGVLVLPTAERLSADVSSSICAVLDRGEYVVEREVASRRAPCRVSVVALDEGLDEEGAPASLVDRLAIHVSLERLEARARLDEGPEIERCAQARALLARVAIDEPSLEALTGAAAALGVTSSRAVVLAAATARAHAARRGRARVEEPDALAAARLVLGPRAVRLPPSEDSPGEATKPQEVDAAAPLERGESAGSADAAGERDDRALDEVVLESARAGIPAGLLDTLAAGRDRRSGPRRAGGQGARRLTTRGGRPSATRAAQLRDGERLNVVETLRAAAPWQRVRSGGASATDSPRRMSLRKDDLRVYQFQERAETCVVFCVDASGSAALQRLAEAKGAVELILADCYVRRDQVALVAFGGAGARLLLPPTRSLIRARRCLADLAGGGATPLAQGFDTSLALALDARKRGRTPLLVVMTDGRANVARDGAGSAGRALDDAVDGARRVRAACVPALFLDTAPRPRPEARRLASEMAARYLPLPHLNAAGISREVRSLALGKP